MFSYILFRHVSDISDSVYGKIYKYRSYIHSLTLDYLMYTVFMVFFPRLRIPFQYLIYEWSFCFLKIFTSQLWIERRLFIMYITLVEGRNISYEAE